jgi:hypothetical protein
VDIFPADYSSIIGGIDFIIFAPSSNYFLFIDIRVLALLKSETSKINTLNSSILLPLDTQLGFLK